jgi:hypothetical protein
MPVLCRNLHDDVELIYGISLAASEFWNDNGGCDHGVRLFAVREKAEMVSVQGDRVLAAFFPDPPGPFKRLAALLVTSRLIPESLFCFASADSTLGNIKPAPPAIAAEWESNLSYLLIQPAFTALRVYSQDGKPNELTDWKGFPSIHSKAEFLLWLRWLRDYPAEVFSKTPGCDDVNMERRGRTVLATALILEAVYYQDKTRLAGICSMCDEVLEGEDRRHIMFDAYLSAEESKRTAQHS